MGTIALTRLSDQICSGVSLKEEEIGRIPAPGAIQDHQWRSQLKWNSFTRLDVRRVVKPATKKRGCSGRLASGQGTPFWQPFAIPPMSSCMLGGVMEDTL